MGDASLLDDGLLTTTVPVARMVATGASRGHFRGRFFMDYGLGRLDETPFELFTICPVPKPRQGPKDKYDPSPSVIRYRAFVNECRLRRVAPKPEAQGVIFVLPMPASWSAEKRERMIGQPHRQRPDRDNLEKALADAVWTEDGLVWDWRASKVWGFSGALVFYESPRHFPVPFRFSTVPA